MKQKDLITYGLIGLAVYFLFMKKEDEKTEDTTGAGGNDSTPELATNTDKKADPAKDYGNDGSLYDGSAQVYDDSGENTGNTGKK
jgi:hypothetical protein